MRCTPGLSASPVNPGKQIAQHVGYDLRTIERPLSNTIELDTPAGKSHRSILRRSPQTNGSSSPDRRTHSRIWRMPELGVLRWRPHDHCGGNFEFLDPGEKPAGRRSHPKGAPLAGYGCEFDRHGHLPFGFGWRDLPVCTWGVRLAKASSTTTTNSRRVRFMSGV
jgi:hypothetical protein